MKRRLSLGLAVLFLAAAVVVSYGQDKATVRMEKPDPIVPGGAVAFTMKLNEPLPAGAHFDFRISPVSADEEIPLGSGEPVKGSNTEFRVAGKLPEGALPGEWHVSVIYLFLPGAGWTHNTIQPNDLRFHVEGRAYPIPTQAEVSLAR
jgi:hypothetical protein